MMPVSCLAGWVHAGGRLPLSLNNGSNKEKRAANRKVTLQLLVCLSPVATWLGAITALPHKEERFLFVVYPLVSERVRGGVVGWVCLLVHAVAALCCSAMMVAVDASATWHGMASINPWRP